MGTETSRVLGQYSSTPECNYKWYTLHTAVYSFSLANLLWKPLGYSWAMTLSKVKRQKKKKLMLKVMMFINLNLKFTFRCKRWRSLSHRHNFIIMPFFLIMHFCLSLFYHIVDWFDSGYLQKPHKSLLQWKKEKRPKWNSAVINNATQEFRVRTELHIMWGAVRNNEHIIIPTWSLVKKQQPNKIILSLKSIQSSRKKVSMKETK